MVGGYVKFTLALASEDVKPQRQKGAVERRDPDFRHQRRSRGERIKRHSPEEEFCEKGSKNRCEIFRIIIDLRSADFSTT